MATGLLVSVRDRDEALDALAAGADFIDLKEPRRGSLGPVDVEVMRDVVSAVGGRAPVSAALGELVDLVAPRLTTTLPAGLALAKFGLAGCAARDGWREQLTAAVAALPGGTGGVAVVYADWQRAAAPEPQQILDIAPRAGCRAVLIDTYNKTVGGLLDLWSFGQCARAIEQIQAVGLLAVLGGSLTAMTIERLLPLAADYVAVRGAVCAGPRTGRLSAVRVRELKSLVAACGARLAGSSLPTIGSSLPSARCARHG